ncbi:PREDICTED: UPF0577 protein KIAA1324-like [Calidris pugnax]|uniref:UPF0577 protein KIAA1324-like n=1 Tax=Calidris pugnax TaxID=198806 RepID=UPI00071D1DA8|nr:PREDICTED: UPF0577 protein KIAA1324-like [Calidris pugnax]
MKAQACRPCAEGTYSLGTGVRFDEWDEVPHGFANVATNLEVAEGFGGEAAENCTGCWPMSPPASRTTEPSSQLIVLVATEPSHQPVAPLATKPSCRPFALVATEPSCWPVVPVATKPSIWLIVPGTTEPSHWPVVLVATKPSISPVVPGTTEPSRWPVALMATEPSPPADWLPRWPTSPPASLVFWWPPSPPAGQLSWWPLGPPAGRLPHWPPIPPARVAYTSECFPCKPGTFAPAAGSSSCQLCPPDTFSSKGATACQPCEPSHYAEPGSASCKPRPPCTDKDYFYTHTACDTRGETQLMFKWAEPKICSEELPQAAQLPPSGVKTQCPPCNPGFAKGNGSVCQPCPYGSYSNGSGKRGPGTGTEGTLLLPGVAYTSECFPCKPGTFAPAAGSSSCQLCPPDTFSSKGATACQPCEPSHYAEPGSASCKPRPPCTDKDYFYTHTACDTRGETQLMFKWAEPKICSEELPQAAQLPPSGVKTQCPPCNPGFAKGNSSVCQPCPYGSYSNGSGCLSCPAGTEPVLGLEYKWWNVLPPNMETTVLSGINFEYKGMAGWEVAGDYIYTAAGASDNDFMILTLVVPGFSPPNPVLEDVENKEVARITFVFETICSVSCELYFMVGVNSRTNTPVETWTGPKGKQSYTYVVEKNATMSFTWAFQRTPYHEAGRRYTNDVAKLYSINVTNVLGGVASFCRRCVPEPAGSCAPCPPGNALDPTSGTCQPCPPGTYLRGHPSGGTPSCHPCGPGTRSNQLRSLCYNNCSFSLALRGRVLRYDLSALAPGAAFASGPSFTAKGLKYFHHFNISLCGHQGRKLASCSDNVTDARLAGGEGDPSRVVRSHVCQSILVPPDLVGYKTPVSSQPVSLADRLLGVTTASTLDGVTSPPEHFPPGHPDLPDIVFFYRSNDVRRCRSLDFWLKVGISAGTCTALLLAALATYFWKKNQKLEYKYSKLVMNAAAKENELPAPDSCAIMEGEDAEDDLVFASKNSLFGKIKSLASKVRKGPGSPHPPGVKSCWWLVTESQNDTGLDGWAKANELRFYKTLVDMGLGAMV